jgi:hypothetical protein
VRRAVDDHGVAGHELARPNEQQVADGDVIGAHVVDRGAAQPVCGPRRRRFERTHGVRRSALGIPLQRLAARLHEDDDEPHDRMPEKRGGNNGQRRHDVGGELTAHRPPQRAPDDCAAGDREPRVPDYPIVRGPGFEQRRREAAEDEP